ncbi:hypothetical protein C7S14_2534 [Burkholderia cepacia]|nr:hypothetical protein C7S14_2534 [Burkholderia cepacia]
MCRSERGHLVYVREAGQRGENRIRARSGPVRGGRGAAKRARIGSFGRAGGWRRPGTGRPESRPAKARDA